MTPYGLEMGSSDLSIELDTTGSADYLGIPGANGPGYVLPPFGLEMGSPDLSIRLDTTGSAGY